MDSDEPADSATRTILTPGSANILECSASEDSGDQAARLQKLFNLLSLQDSGVPDHHLQELKKLIKRNADMFALDSTELGFTDLVQHHVDTGFIPPIKQPARHVAFVFRNKIGEMVEDVGVNPTFYQFARIASPLHAILKKDAVFNWTADSEAAFGRLKEVFPFFPTHNSMVSIPSYWRQTAVRMVWEPCWPKSRRMGRSTRSPSHRVH